MTKPSTDTDPDRRDWTLTQECQAAAAEHSRLAGAGELPLTPYALQVLRELEAGIRHAAKLENWAAGLGFREQLTVELMTHRRALIDAGCALNSQPLLTPKGA